LQAHGQQAAVAARFAGASLLRGWKSTS